MRSSLLLICAALANPVVARAQNLLANPRFDTNLSAWATLGSGVARWSLDDADGSMSSGSAHLTPMCGTVRASQCLLASAGAYDFRVSVRTANGSSSAMLAFYSSSDCTGEPIVGAGLSFSPPLPSVWTAFAGRTIRPPESRSLAARANATEVFCEPCFLFTCPESWFDNFTLTEAPRPATRFYTVSPCRLFDTRGNDGPPIEAMAERRLPTASRCEIPTTAVALSLNITVAEGTAAGDLRLFAAGFSAPSASTLNYGPGQTRANNAVVTRGTGGEIVVRSDQPTGTVHLIVDVAGYFE